MKIGFNDNLYFTQKKCHKSKCQKHLNLLRSISFDLSTVLVLNVKIQLDLKIVERDLRIEAQ